MSRLQALLIEAALLPVTVPIWVGFAAPLTLLQVSATVRNVAVNLANLQMDDE